MANDISAAPPDVLARICADTRAAVARHKIETSVDDLRDQIASCADRPVALGPL